MVEKKCAFKFLSLRESLMVWYEKAKKQIEQKSASSLETYVNLVPRDRRDFQVREELKDQIFELKVLDQKLENWRRSLQ